jgi:hypothetical protein
LSTSRPSWFGCIFVGDLARVRSEDLRASCRENRLGELQIFFLVSYQGPVTGLRVILQEFLVFIPLSGGRMVSR